jgi:hypothetical protein
MVPRRRVERAAADTLATGRAVRGFGDYRTLRKAVFATTPMFLAFHFSFLFCVFVLRLVARRSTYNVLMLKGTIPLHLTFSNDFMHTLRRG